MANRRRTSKWRISPWSLFVTAFLSIGLAVMVVSVQKPTPQQDKPASAATSEALAAYETRKLDHENNFGTAAVKSLYEEYAKVNAAGTGSIPQRIDVLKPIKSYTKQIEVFAISYFPKDPKRSTYLDPIETGWGGSNYGDLTLAAWEANTQKEIDNGAKAVSNATRYKGYLYSYVEPYVNYHIYSYVKKYEKIPRGQKLGTGKDGVTTEYRPNYRSILLNNNICDLVDNKGIREVWMYGYHFGEIAPDESRMSSKYGDISNSLPKEESVDDTFKLPLCNHTYVLYNFTYDPNGNFGDNIHNRMHQMENIAAYIDGKYSYPFAIENINNGTFFGDYSELVDKSTIKNYRSSCGNGHYTPNWADPVNDAYQYGLKKLDSFDCEYWRTGAVSSTSINQDCTEWDCTDVGFYVWFFQNIPGQAASPEPKTLTQPRTFRNWWEAFVDFDSFIAKGRTPFTDDICIKGTLFEDSNNDGLPEAGRWGNLQVQIAEKDHEFFDTIKTDIQGKYMFCGLKAQQYEIRVPIISQYQLSSVSFDPNNNTTIKNTGKLSINNYAYTSKLVDVVNSNKNYVDFGFSKLPNQKFKSEVYTEGTSQAWQSLNVCVGYPVVSGLTLYVDGKLMQYTNCSTTAAAPYAGIELDASIAHTISAQGMPDTYRFRRWELSTVTTTGNKVIAGGDCLFPTSCSIPQYYDLPYIVGASYLWKVFIIPPAVSPTPTLKPTPTPTPNPWPAKCAVKCTSNANCVLATNICKTDGYCYAPNASQCVTPTITPTPTPLPRVSLLSEVETLGNPTQAWQTDQVTCGPAYAAATGLGLGISGDPLSNKYSSCSSVAPNRPYAIKQGLTQGTYTASVHALPSGFTCEKWELYQRTPSNILVSKGNNCGSASVALNYYGQGTTYLLKFYILPPNLLLNGSFETDANADKIPDNWTASQNKISIATLLSFFKGSSSMRHESITDTNYTVDQTVGGIIAGKKYVVTAATYIPNPSVADPLSYSLYLQWRNSTNTLISEVKFGEYTGPTTSWVQAKGTYTAPVNAARATVVMRVSSFQSVIYTDYLTLGQLP